MQGRSNKLDLHARKPRDKQESLVYFNLNTGCPTPAEVAVCHHFNARYESRLNVELWSSLFIGVVAIKDF